MARTKGKPGPKPKYGDREEIHVLVPVSDLAYIRSVTSNTTEWVIQAIQEKRANETKRQPAAAKDILGKDILVQDALSDMYREEHRKRFN